MLFGLDNGSDTETLVQKSTYSRLAINNHKVAVDTVKRRMKRVTKLTGINFKIFIQIAVFKKYNVKVLKVYGKCHTVPENNRNFLAPQLTGEVMKINVKLQTLW